MTRQLNKFHALPRIWKWVIGAVLVAVAYLVIIDPVLSRIEKFNARAESLERAIARDQELGTVSGDGWTIESGQAIFGSPNRPGDGVVTPESFTRVVNAVLSNHGVFDRNISESSVPLSGDSAAALGVGDIKRHILQVSFEADAPTVVSVLAELEKRPEVAAVSRIRLETASGRNADADADMLRATISTEGWVASIVDPALARTPASASAAAKPEVGDTTSSESEDSKP
jgi:hypothetical protein